MTAYQVVHAMLDSAAQAWPNDISIEEGKRVVTFKQLRHLSVESALWLKESGVKFGSRVVINGDNSIETIALVFGTLAVGAAFCLVHSSIPAEQLSYVSENAEASLNVHVREGCIKDERTNNYLPLSSLVPDYSEDTNSIQLADIEPVVISEDLACLIYTSGSTSRPKGVTCLHRQVTFSVSAIAHCLRYRKNDRVYNVLPLSFDYGLYQIFLSITAGSVLLLADPRASGPNLINSLIATQATVLPAVAPMLDNISILLRKRIKKLDRLRLITNTGAVVSQSTLNRIRTHIPSVRIQLMYGLTECKRAAINPPDADLERSGSCGRPLPGTRIRIVDSEHRDLPAGKVGQIVVSGPNVMFGYWKEPILTAKRFKIHNVAQRELLTGDYGWLDEDGYLYFTGRRDDIFKQKGFRVSCTEIEAATCEIDGVKSAVLVPPQQGRSSILFFCGVCRAEEVLSQLVSKIESYKLPGQCIGLPRMPKNQNGKFDRKRLREYSLEFSKKSKGQSY